MRVLCFLFFALLGTCGSNTSNGNAVSNGDHHDDRIFAEVLPYAEGDRFGIDIVIYLDISEIVDGHEIRGFGKKPLDVKDPTLDKKPMQSREQPANSKSYFAVVDQLDKDFTVRFELNGQKYSAEFHLTPDDLNKRKTAAVRVVDEIEDK